MTIKELPFFFSIGQIYPDQILKTERKKGRNKNTAAFLRN